MRRSWLVVTLGLLAACGGGPGIPPGTVSCQPYGYTPAPIPFSVQLGPVTAAEAEERAVALYRSCTNDGGTISELTSTSEAGTGSPHGPNAGRPVWVVKVDAVVDLPGSNGSYGSHFWIEVNQSTGMPVVMGYG